MENRKKKNVELLEELLFCTIQEALLKEEDGGGDGGGGDDYGGAYDGLGDYGGGGGGGGNTGVGGDLWNTFVQPFTDIVNTGLFALKSITADVKHLLLQFLREIPNLFIPFWRVDYEKHEKEREDQLVNLKNQYSSILRRNLTALKDHDLWGVGFFLDPSSMLAGKFLTATPDLVEQLMELVGFDARDLIPGGDFIAKRDRYKHNYYSQVYQDDFFHESILREASLPKDAAERLRNAQPVVEFRKAYFSSIINHVKEILDATLKDYETMVRSGAVNKVLSKDQQMLGDLYKQGKIQPDQVEAIKRVIVKTARESLVGFYVKELEELDIHVPTIKPEIDNCIGQLKKLAGTS